MVAKGTTTTATDWDAVLRLLPGYDPFATATPDCFFDPAAAQRACEFFPEVLRHVEGELAGQPFRLEPWQQSLIANLFGWQRKDGRGRTVRRYRECLLYVPRKNGKTPLAAGIAAYVLFCDPEAGQQNYIAASTREQAGMLFRQLRGMVERQPILSKRCRVYGGTAAAGQSKSIVKKPEYEGSSIKIISADGAAQHGQNPHLIIVDELHTQPSRELIDTLRTGMASQNRAQPLTIYLTTADYERESICNEVHKHAQAVRDGTFPDPAFLPASWESSVEADWRDEAVWAAANPNLGVSVSADYLRREVAAVAQEPARLNEFLRLHLNVVTKQRTRWLDHERWAACRGADDWRALADCLPAQARCGGGLDLSSKYDLTAFVLCFPLEGGRYALLPRFWVPAETAKESERKHGIPWSAWQRSGAVELTPGASVDYEAVEAQIVADHTRWQIETCHYDPWNANATRTRLENQGVAMVEFRQSLAQFNEPTKEFGRLVREGLFEHGGHPVLTWCADNVEVFTDASGNIRPVKAKENSPQKIDGIVAAIMALAGVLGASKTSVYATRGLVFV
jgi:phage terminase large subunit-like protein